MINKKIAVIGAGGHAKVVASIIHAMGKSILAFYDDNPKKIGTSIFGIRVKDKKELVENSDQDAIIAIGNNQVRKKICNELNLNWVSVIHPFSFVHPEVEIGAGTVVCAGSIIQPGAKIGSHVIINTKSSVDHDTIVGDYSHISVAHLAGGASIDEGVFLALHSVVLPFVHIGSWSIVGAGAVVTKNVDPGLTVIGVPARPNKTSTL